LYLHIAHTTFCIVFPLLSIKSPQGLYVHYNLLLDHLVQMLHNRWVNPRTAQASSVGSSKTRAVAKTTTPMTTYFNEPITPPKQTNQATAERDYLQGLTTPVPPGTLIMVTGRCSTSQYRPSPNHNRAGKAITALGFMH